MTLVGIGLIIGWLLASERSSVEETASRPAPSGPTSTISPGAQVMPDLRGLGVGDARQILADLGVPPGAVTLRDQPAAGESGVILAQDPVYGYALGSRIVLSASRPAKVPAFKGRDATAVLADLDELGAATRTISRYTPGVPVGNVASISPEPGTLLPVDVTVVVSAEPDSVNLAELVAAEDNCYTDTDSLNGKQYDELLTCETDRYPLNQTWVVKRAADRVSGVLGVPDSGEPKEAVELRIIADGEVLTTLTTEYGSVVPFDVSIAGKLRLTFQVRSQTREYSTAGLARLKLLGDAKLLNKLEVY
ncbi:PASTA domain-containing protein [Nocardioides sp.]|uniref:PASTA domain-containing protein n=1 Tax=Nocardioides sp. TaxID=35761 RepID=UPI003D0B4885